MEEYMMKRMKKLCALLLAMAIGLSLVACGPTGDDQPSDAGTPSQASGEDTPAPENSPDAPPEHIGTIMWLSNLSSGIQYETSVAYMEAICDRLGYDLTVVYGDSFNDAAGNLNAVMNGMTNDVVGLVVSQDGGLASIMEEYPDLYVAGYNTDMRSVYNDGENAACLSNDHFLGTIADGYADGTQMGIDYANAVIEKGYHKVAIVQFPFYAYPNQAEAEVSFRAAIEEYNATASEPIEIVGDTLTLEFQPLPDSYFLEDGHDDLDCIVALCAGTLFVAPSLITAISNGTCSADTKMVTGGFDENAVENTGDDKLITWTQVSPAEDPAYALVLLDNAITGNQYADFEAKRIDSAPYTIASSEDVTNVTTKAMCGTADVSLAQLSVDEVANLCVRFNSGATQAQLIETMHSQQLYVESLKNR